MINLFDTFLILGLFHGTVLALMIKVGAVYIPRECRRPAIFGLGLSFTVGAVIMFIGLCLISPFTQDGNPGIAGIIILTYPLLELILFVAGVGLLLFYAVNSRIKRARADRSPAAAGPVPEAAAADNPAPSPGRE